jgi:branched-chain amino acid transport system permease protein
MDLQIFTILLEDGIASGAIYALLALTMVLVFATTRILFVSQGEFVTFSALSFASFQLGIAPQIVWLLAVVAVIVTVLEVTGAIRDQQGGRVPKLIAVHLVLPAVIIVACLWAAPLKLHVLVQAGLSVALVTALGPGVYRLAFQPVANASVRTLFVIAIALHFILQGFGLLFFGAEGYRVDPLINTDLSLGATVLKGQAMLVLGTLAVSTTALYVFFEYTLLGKALRATAINRIGARIVGIKTPLAGRIAFTLSAFIGAIAGILAVGSTTIYYDSGFLIGLKSVLGAICGAMLSYPLAILGAIGVGILETFSAFWVSAFTEAVVFSALIPVLLWLSFYASPSEEGQEL